jgi:CysZ protein
MKSIRIHIQALQTVINELKDGRFLKYFIPGLIAALLFGSFFTIFNRSEGLLSFIEKVPLIGNFLSAGVSKTFGMFYFLIMQVYIFFVLTVLSPFNTLLSEALDGKLTGQDYPFDFAQVFSDLLRMILLVLISFVLEFFFMGAYWLLSWFLGLGFLDIIVYTLITAFFFGLSFYDCSLERYKVGVFSSFNFAFSNFWMVTLTGLIFLIIFSIPFIGIPIAPVVATMLTTVVYLNFRKTNSTT